MTNDELFRRAVMDGRIRDQHGEPVLRLIVTEAEPRDYPEVDEPMPFEARPSTLPDPWIIGIWLLLAGIVVLTMGVCLAQLGRL